MPQTQIGPMQGERPISILYHSNPYFYCYSLSHPKYKVRAAYGYVTMCCVCNCGMCETVLYVTVCGMTCV